MSATITHTPGPWRVSALKSAFGIYTASGDPVARTAPAGSVSVERRRADARLMAASQVMLPALFRAAAALESVSYRDPSIESALQVVRDAIKEATGAAT